MQLTKGQRIGGFVLIASVMHLTKDEQLNTLAAPCKLGRSQDYPDLQRILYIHQPENIIY